MNANTPSSHLIVYWHEHQHSPEGKEYAHTEAEPYVANHQVRIQAHAAQQFFVTVHLASRRKKFRLR